MAKMLGIIILLWQKCWGIIILLWLEASENFTTVREELMRNFIQGYTLILFNCMVNLPVEKLINPIRMNIFSGVMLVPINELIMYRVRLTAFIGRYALLTVLIIASMVGYFCSGLMLVC
ncbi:hypothetical protein V8G54_025239 [Vigna mungo]|uniref:Uncharacterized protein n=1 Tax=Vigna mungo TaxID=3915 RepID=A0AAQ3N7A4_VIGMU